MAVRGLVHSLFAASLLLAGHSEASPRPDFHTNVLKKPWVKWDRRDGGSSTACDGMGDAPTIKAPHQNIWATLTNDEVSGLLEWLYKPEQGLNLTVAEEAGAWDNTVGITELLMPNKTDALAYISGSGPAPERHARVGVFFGATESPYMQNYVVGPLPVSEKTTIAPLDYIYTKKSGRMPNYDADAVAVYFYKLSVTASIADITQDLLGITVTGGANDTGQIAGTDPVHKEGDRIIDWTGFWLIPTNGFDDGTILAAGMWLKFDITGRDPSKWSCEGAFYNNVFYESLDKLRAAWKKPGFVKLTKTKDGQFGSTARHGDELPYETLPPPSMVSTAKRYSVDKDNKYVKWMDFDFYLAFDRDTGLKFYEIKYKGERIIFELGLQEGLAHYAGHDPLQSGISYLDTWYGFGSQAFPLVPGWDCPAYATYLDNVLHDNGNTTVHKASVCMFEQDAGFPLSRHTGAAYVTVTKNVQFVIRWVATIGNYDYFFDYVFNLDGTIEVKARASGYIQGAYYANNGDYGYKIHDSLSGSMHDHVINYKLDLDVNGTANSLEKVEFVPHTEKYKWAKEPRNTMKIRKSWIKDEDHSKLKWTTNSAASYVVVNKDAPNAYGEYRGYKISPNLGSPVYLTVKDSTNLQSTVNFATHNLFATKQKDTEPRSAAAWNNQDPSDPLVDFGKFFNGESLEQEDLVIWFNLGMHHVPHTGDLPNTVFTTAQAGIAISPHNYLMGDPSRQTSHSIYIDKTGETAEAKSYGGQEAVCAYDLTKLHPDLASYPQMETTRKWPDVYVGGGS